MTATTYFLPPPRTTSQGGEYEFEWLDVGSAQTGSTEHGDGRNELPTALSFRPICTLRRAGVSAGIRETFVWRLRRYKSTHPGQFAYAQMASKQVSRKRRQLPQKQRLPGKPALTPRSRHGNGHLAQRGLIRLWRRSSKHMQEPWLTMITASGADSSISRMVAAMANSERLRLMS